MTDDYLAGKFCLLKKIEFLKPCYCLGKRPYIIGHIFVSVLIHS